MKFMTWGLPAIGLLISISKATPRQFSHKNTDLDPTRPNESAVSGFTLDLPTSKTEIEGVCKISEDSISCWRPNGEHHVALEQDLDSAFRSRSSKNPWQFPMVQGKKCRILVLRITQTPNNYSTTERTFLPGQYDFRLDEHWKDDAVTIPLSPNADSNTPKMERRLIFGTFGRDRETTAFRCQSLNFNYKTILIPFRTGPFEICGSKFEIAAISSKFLENTPEYRSRVDQYGLAPERTFIRVLTERVEDPNMYYNLFAANAQGKQFYALDEKGRPLTFDDVQKVIRDHNSSVTKNVKADKNNKIDYNWRPYRFGFNQIIIDPLLSNGQRSLDRAFDAPVNKIKMLSIQAVKRSIYVFNDIQLDPR